MNLPALKSLGHHTGTEGYHRFSPLFRNLLLTDGAKALAEHAEAFWLMDLIGSHQPTCKKDASLQQMQFWHLVPAPKKVDVAPMTVGSVLASKAKAARLTFPTEGGILTYMRCEEGEPMAYAVCYRDSGDAAIVQEIAYTSFPFDAMPKVEVWVEPTEIQGAPVSVVLLPSEH